MCVISKSMYVYLAASYRYIIAVTSCSLRWSPPKTQWSHHLQFMTINYPMSY